MDIIYWLIRSSSKMEGDGVKGWIGGIVILAICEYQFNKEQHPGNNISIFKEKSS